MGSQVNIQGNEAKTKNDDSGACAIHSLDQPNGDPIDISPAKPSAFLPAIWEIMCFTNSSSDIPSFIYRKQH